MPTPPFALRRRRAGVASLAAALMLCGAPLAASAQIVQWSVAAGGNGHWYQYVPAVSIFQGTSFETARAAALASSHLGLNGYLATVTSAAEHAFITGSFGFLVGFGATGTAWLGASDAQTEGIWRWLDGPEAGQALGFTAWAPGRPLTDPNFPAYDYLALLINAQGQPTSFSWVDAESTGALGYVIEYGDGSTPPVPEPGSLPMLALGAAAVAAFALRRRRPADGG